MNHSVRMAATFSLMVAALPCLAADETGRPTEPSQSRVAQIRGVLETLRPTVLFDKGNSAADLLPTPSLLYADNSRDLANSSLWVWVHASQPVAVTAIEWHLTGENQGRWTFEFASLCSEKIRITLPSDTWTTTDISHVTLIPNAPAVADNRPQRMLQMKKLSERFAAVEQHPTEGRIQLRRLATPIYRQAEDGDSAMFAFSNGTNPEVALLIAVVDDHEREKAWGFRAAALSSTELTVLLDDQKVWGDVRFTRPGTRGNYANGVLKAEPNVKSDSTSPK
jgi:hypothetical protein